MENHYANLCSYNHTLFKHGRENERGGVDMIKRWDGMRVSHCIHRGCAAVRKGGWGPVGSSRLRSSIDGALAGFGVFKRLHVIEQR